MVKRKPSTQGCLPENASVQRLTSTAVPGHMSSRSVEIDVCPHLAFEMISPPVEQRSHCSDVYPRVGLLAFCTVNYSHAMTYLQETSWS